MIVRNVADHTIVGDCSYVHLFNSAKVLVVLRPVLDEQEVLVERSKDWEVFLHGSWMNLCEAMYSRKIIILESGGLQQPCSS